MSKFVHIDEYLNWCRVIARNGLVVWYKSGCAHPLELPRSDVLGLLRATRQRCPEDYNTSYRQGNLRVSKHLLEEFAKIPLKIVGSEDV